jgi:hypothetical protein
MLGPGAVLVGLSVGAGEIVIWPRTVAQHGAGLIWAAVLGVFIQLWVNFEIGRWTLATGETVFTGFARAWRGFVPLFMVLTVLGWLAPGWAQASGSALKSLLFGVDFGKGTIWGSTTLWTCITFGAAAGMILGPKFVYKSVERIIAVLVLVITVGLVIVAVTVGGTETWAELGKGIVNVGHKPAGVPIKDLFTWIVFAGAGGTSNLFYSFYLRDKQMGMAAHAPVLTNPLHGRTEATAASGHVFADTPANRSAFRQWMRVMRWDQALIFWLLNTFTLLLFIYGALAVLKPMGRVPEPGRLIWDESVVLGESWGQWGPACGRVGQIVFLLVGVATLFSTQLGLVDGVARSLSDMLCTNFRPFRSKGTGFWYVAIAVGWMAVGCLITGAIEAAGVKDQDLGVLLNAAYMGGFAMAVYVPLMLFINLRYLPRTARPGWFSIAMMAAATMLYGGFAMYCLIIEVRTRWGG